MTELPPAAGAGAVAAALCAWAGERFGGPAVVAEPAVEVAGGMDSRIHLVRLAGDVLPAAWREPVVARVLPHADRFEQAVQEAAIQGWCADQGYPTPRVLAVAAPGEVLDLPVQVMERAPGTTMASRIADRPWTAPAEVDRLAHLQVVLHRLDAGSWVGQDRPSLLSQRLGLVRRATERLPDAPLTAALRQVDGLRERLEAAPATICHGDFHPLNVLVDGAQANVIDWSDAGLGDRHGDVARTALLLRMAARFAGGRAERAALRVGGPLLARRYLRAYGRSLPLEPDRLRLWEPVHLLHGWAQVEVAQGALGQPGAPTDEPDRRLQAALGTWFRSQFERRMAELT